MGLYYCVSVTGTPTTRTAPYVSTTTTSSAPVATNCVNKWYVGADDTCQSISDTNGISLVNFIAWNPQLDATTSSCSVSAGTYVCIGVISGSSSTDLFGTSSTTMATNSTISSTLSTTSASTSAGASSSTSSSTSTTSAVASTTSTAEAVSTPVPTQAGMVAGCEYHVSLLSLIWTRREFISNTAG